MATRPAGQRASIATIIWVLWLLASAGVAGTVRRARDALVAEAVKGKLTPKVIELYYRYAGQGARAAAPADKVTNDFWKWLDASPTIREGTLAGMDCAYAGHVVGRLAELRSEFGGDVDRYAHLAIAFALVYGRAGDESIRQWTWVAKGRPVPSMIESFRYYIGHDGEMLFPLQATPWPLLVHVADIDVPIAEREWALSKYHGRTLRSLRRIHSDPSYRKGTGAVKRAEEVAAPIALPAILQYGGVCSQKAYYAASVLKSFGVPAFRLVGGHHAWEGWVLPAEPKGYRMSYNAAFGRKSGHMKCPLTHTGVRQHEVEMRVAAVSESYAGYLAARVAAAACAMVPPDRRGPATGLLWAALSRNGHCTEVWRHLAQACTEGILADADAKKVYPTALRVLAKHPQMTCELFATLISPTLRAAGNTKERALADVARAIESEAARYEQLKRDDLGAQLRNLLGSHVSAVKGPATVCELYRSWLAGTAPSRKGWYLGLLKHLMKLTGGKEALPARVKFLAGELAQHPARLAPSRKALKKDPEAKGKVNVLYIRVAGAYVNTLRKLGRKDEAARLKAKIADLTAKDK